MPKSPPKPNVWKSISYGLIVVLQSMIAVGVHDMRNATTQASETAEKNLSSIRLIETLIEKTMYTKLEGQALGAKVVAVEVYMATRHRDTPPLN